jgi:hypothetical protein
MSLNQKQAVYVAIMNLLAEKGIPFDDGQTPTAAELLDSADRKKIVAVLTEGFKTGEIEMKDESRAKHNSDQALSKYSSELLSNHLRKDTRLTGGNKYEAKNPGSRAGSQDPTIHALRALRKQKQGDDEAIALIDAEIANRMNELGLDQPKAKVPVINVELLPEHLRKYVK